MATNRAAMVVRIGANVEDLRKALTGAEIEIKTSTQQMERMAASFRGEGLIAAAGKSAAVIKEIGVAALSTSRASKELDKLTAAIDQMRRIGEPVPAIYREMQAELAKALPLQDRLARSVGLTGDVFGKLQGVAGAFGIGLGASAFVGFGKEIIESGSQIQDMSEKLDVSTAAVQKWSFAAKQTGSDWSQISTSVAFMNKTLAGGDQSTVNALRDVGLSFADIRRLDPETAFEEIATAIKAIPDPMTQARVAVELFGKSGQDLLPAIKEGLVDIGRQAPIMSAATVKALDDIGDQWEKTKAKLSVRSAPVLVEALKGLQYGIGPETLYNPFTGEGRIKDAWKEIFGVGDIPELKRDPLTSLRRSFDDTSMSMDQALATTDKLKAAAERDTEAQKKHAEAIKEMAKRASDLAFAGRDAASGIRLLTAASQEIKLPEFLTDSEKMARTNAVIKTGFQGTRDAMRELLNSSIDVTGSIKEQNDQLAKQAKQLVTVEELYSRMLGDVGRIGSGLGFVGDQIDSHIVQGLARSIQLTQSWFGAIREITGGIRDISSIFSTLSGVSGAAKRSGFSDLLGFGNVFGFGSKAAASAAPSLFTPSMIASSQAIGSGTTAVGTSATATGASAAINPIVAAAVGGFLGISALVSATRNATKGDRDAFAKSIGFANLDELNRDLLKHGSAGASVRAFGLNSIGKHDKFTEQSWEYAVKNIYSMPHYATGINSVPQDGPAYLHRGERVVPASQNYTGGDLHVHPGAIVINGATNPEAVARAVSSHILRIWRNGQGGENGRAPVTQLRQMGLGAAY